MASELNNNIYQKKENKYRYLDSNKSKNKNNRIYKTKTDILPYNQKYKQEPKIYIKLDPEYLENNYKKAEKKYSTKKNDKEYLNNINNAIDNDNRKINNYIIDKENKTTSPIKKYIEKKNFNFYLNKGIKTQNQNLNDINKNEEYYINKSVDLNYTKNNRYNDYNENDSIRTSQTQGNKNLDSLNINKYIKNMITIFVRIINKIIQKNKKRNILKIFLYNFKNYYYINNKEEKNNFNKKFKKKNTKYNEYKNIINNYVKANNNNKKDLSNNKSNELINRMKNRNKDSFNQRNNNTILKNQKTENDLKRLKELQKKYAQIYEKKKNTNISNDYKYINYILRKTKTQNTFTNNDLNNKSVQNNYYYSKDISEILNEKKKAKLLKNKLIRDMKESPQTSLRRKYYPYMNYQKSQTFNTISNFEESEQTPTKKNNSKIIVKKLRITPKLSKNFKKENPSNKKEEKYKIYNIKDIVSKDKRLYVYINYITLYNKKEDENSMDYYDNDILKIVNEINIDIYGLNKNKKNRVNRYLLKYHKNLGKIEEESYNRGNEKMKFNNNIEKGILKLENYKNKLKNETIKKSIINSKN